MKKALILSTGMVACFMFSSCYKVWKCDCTYSVSCDSTHVGPCQNEFPSSNETFAASKKEAKKHCQEQEDQNTYYRNGMTRTGDCKLK